MSHWGHRPGVVDLQRKLRLTTIFVTHDQEEANTISNRMAVLNGGVIQQVGARVGLYDNPAIRFVDDTHQVGRTVFEIGDSVATRLDARQIRVLTV